MARLRLFILTSRDLIAIDSAEWGSIVLHRIDIETVAEITGRPMDDCLHRLQSIRLADLAAEWNELGPSSPEEIRGFYASPDDYLWGLLAWNSSSEYAPYLARLERLAELWPPGEYPRALDYGSGVGTAALHLAKAGYEVTIADVPGKTLEWAASRLRRHGVDFEVMEVTEDVPRIPKAAWDVVASFDVLEHVFEPEAVTRALVRALRVGGGAAIVAAFDTVGEEHPHHLADRSRRLQGHRFEMYLQSLGMKALEDYLYRRLSAPARLPRLVAYKFWRATGLRVTRLPR